MAWLRYVAWHEVIECETDADQVSGLGIEPAEHHLQGSAPRGVLGIDLAAPQFPQSNEPENRVSLLV